MLDSLRPHARLPFEERRLFVPRVFVSHRRADADYALRIAWLANQEGFDFWLDVLDPTLGGIAPGPDASLAIAVAIEMALINSSHVVAVMTQNTFGSRWVPYEYGRAKDEPPITSQAAAWVVPSYRGMQLPEYLHLGPIHYSEAELRAWFRFELGRWLVRPPAFAHPRAAAWPNDLPEPPRLP